MSDADAPLDSDVTLDPAVLVHHLRRLETDACAALVADLWAARGFDTTRDGARVVATRGSSSTTLSVDCGRHLLSSPTIPDDADVVVAPAPSGRLRAAVRASPAMLLDAEALVEMLRFAVDRPAAATLCARHLGAPPSALRPPVDVRARDRLRTAEPAFAQGVLLALVALVVVGSVAVPGLGLGASGVSTQGALGGTPSPSDSASGVDSATTATPTRTPPPPSGADAIPGVSRDGVEDLSALAAAHDRALGDDSYTLWLDRYAPRDGDPNGTRVQLDTDIAVDGERYVLEAEREVNDSRTPVRTVYHDGTDWYVAEWGGESAAYYVVPADGETWRVSPRPDVLRRTMVSTFLSTPSTTVSRRIGRGESAAYRIVGRGRPTRAPSAVHNYTVVALVESDGLVREARATYTVGHGERRYRVRTEWTYGRINATSVEPQPWFERRVASNGTATDGTGA